VCSFLVCVWGQVFDPSKRAQLGQIVAIKTAAAKTDAAGRVRDPSPHKTRSRTGPAPDKEAYSLNYIRRPKLPGNLIAMPDSRQKFPAAVTSRFLVGLDEAAVGSILAAAHVRRVDAKHAIIAAGQKGTHFFLLRAGKARYYKVTETGQEVLLHWLVPGDVFGLVTLLKHPPAYMGTGEALTKCEVLVWEHATMRKLATTYPQLAENGLRIVLHYLKGCVDRHMSLVTKTAEQRLADTLLELGDRAGHAHSEGVEIQVTNEQLSSLADISLFTASRLLSGWEREGTVSKGRGKVLVHTPEALVID
jgi:CRP-like cAMP-binding protein